MKKAAAGFTPQREGTRQRRSLVRRLGEHHFDRLYHWWNQAHAAIVLLSVVLSEFVILERFGFAVLTIWAPSALLLLYLAARKFHPDGAGEFVPNMLTSIRVVGAGLLLLSIAMDSFLPEIGVFVRSSWGFLVVGVLLLVELTDFFDGYLARRKNTGRFGAIWDMESDALLALALALALRQYHEVGFFVVVIGLMKYAYVLLWRFDGDPPAYPRIYKMYAKTTAAVIVTSLILGLLPVLSARLRTVVFIIVLAMQLVSFFWDLLLQRRSLGKQR